jgi:hypothetical protein
MPLHFLRQYLHKRSFNTVQPNAAMHLNQHIARCNILYPFGVFGVKLLVNSIMMLYHAVFGIVARCRMMLHPLLPVV